MSSYPGPQGGGSALDLSYAAELGGLLAQARAERQLSIDQVAARLLLSPRQVRALEQPDPGAFYGEPYFVKGLQKYVEFVGVGGLSEELFERMLSIPAQAPATMPAPAPESVSRERASRVSGTTVLLAAGALVAVLAAGVYLMTGRPGIGQGSLPAGVEAAGAVAPDPLEVGTDWPVTALQSPVPADRWVPESVTVSAPVPPAAPARPAATPPGAGAGRVTVPRPTWVFVRYADNETVERVLQANQAFELASVPIYLAIGLDNPTVTIAGRPVDVQPWITDAHQVRIGRADLAALARR